MGPKTHALTAIPVGMIAATANHADTTHTVYLLAAALLGTTFIPDGPIFLQVVVDKLKGRKLFSEENKQDFTDSFWYISKDITHSFLLWIGVIWLGHLSALPPEWRLYANVIGFGIALHWCIDVFTHTGDVFKRTDQSLIWPFNMMLGEKSFRLGNWVGKNIWGWEYRYDYFADPKNAGKTKPGELDVQIILAIVSFFMIMIYLFMKYYH